MFGIGTTEILVVGVVVLLLFGSARLAEVVATVAGRIRLHLWRGRDGYVPSDDCPWLAGGVVFDQPNTATLGDLLGEVLA
jgi:hypothetical protein